MMKALNRFLFCLLTVFGQALTTPSSFGQEGTAAPAPEEKRATEDSNNTDTALNRIRKRQALLAQELADDSLFWLQTDEGKFIALWEPDTSGNSLGAILILHSAGQTPDWPNTINPLRTSAIQFGWSTLAIELPEPTSDDRTETFAQARIQAAVDFLDEKGQYNLAIFAAGISARWGMKYALAQPSNEYKNQKRQTITTRGPFRAIIMLNAREVKPEKDFLLPTLDLYYDDHYYDDNVVQERLMLAKKYRLPYYHQIHIIQPDSTLSAKENRLTRRVRGFLNKYAKGVEVTR